ncbi:hypothetical protein [Crateriforma conspicua]|uniref:Uncharacterized protein n=1 Tax=Crateriforma conspicua TaxID=2527996 RepID=A0A5C6FYL7_9PLAN|nr:hypothetical protein [Crateriforma conspicua]TWU66448.1 hypothetical protein V7x_20140 [Crateriforma conspicua]
MFLYFVPTTGARVDRTMLCRWGLDRLIDRPMVGRVADGKGPGGQGGIVVADEDAEVECKYIPDRQTWVRRKAVGDQEDQGVWIGYAGDRPPHPLQLARPRPLPGREVQLSDGSRILIPHARRWVEHEERLLWAVALPQSLSRDESGQWVPGDVVREYRRLWDMVGGYLDAREEAIRRADVAEGESVYFQYPRIDEMAIAAVSANYRVGPDEMEICGLYDQPTRSAIVDVLLDEATREAWVKKKLRGLIAAGGNSSAGAERSTVASTTDTPPRSPTCGPGAKAITDTDARHNRDKGPDRPTVGG